MAEGEDRKNDRHCISGSQVYALFSFVVALCDVFSPALERAFFEPPAGGVDSGNTATRKLDPRTACML
jgi:hypothetical protein